jgi:tungstate transport system ATP-binding protein
MSEINPSPPAYSLRGVEKSYAGRKILSIEQLEIAPGEIFALVGPSGAGKSTLLRLLNFLEPADQGRLDYFGQAASPALALAVRRQVTMVFQRPALLNDSVENNVAYGLRLRGLRDHRGRVTEMLQVLGLEQLRRAPARHLSGGEMQRVALARAMVIEPHVLLLDEPTANLDPYNIGLIEDVVRQINRQRGVTLVLVTHNVFQAKRLADRVALLLSGQVVEAAPARVFFENPADTRTRAFVNGEMVY